MGKKSKTTETQSSTQTSTPNVPDWLAQTTMGLNSKIQEIGGYDPYSLVAGPSNLQQQAFTDASTWNPGANYAGLPSVQSASLLDGLQNYVNPYTDSVVNTTLAGFDENAGRTRAQQAANAAANSAFRGSRFGVREAITEGELGRERASAEAGLRNTAFNTAAGLSSQDASRRQEASLANAQQAMAAANARTAAEQSRLGVLSGLGQTQYDQEQARLQAPLDLLKTQTGLFAALDPQSYFSQTTTGNSTGTSTAKSNDIFGGLGKALQVASLFGGR